MNKRVLLALAYATGASTALLLALNLHSLAALAAVFVLAGAYVGMEETLENSLAAESPLALGYCHRQMEDPVSIYP